MRTFLEGTRYGDKFMKELRFEGGDGLKNS
jgi:hypothetical protein